MTSLTQKRALREVQAKSEAAIERDTARNWLARAKACMHAYKTTGSMTWLLRAESYRHEALEHAALANDGGKLVAAIGRSLPRLAGSKKTTHRYRKADHA